MKSLYVTHLFLIAIAFAILGATCTLQSGCPLLSGGDKQAADTRDRAGGVSMSAPGVSAVASVVAAVLSIWYFYKNRRLSRQIADRTVSFEAQKLLLEINKQFIADPSLFTIYDDNDDNKNALKNNPALKAKVQALGYMKLNVFEIVFARLLDVPPNQAWTGYFLDSLDRCTVLSDELSKSRDIYHPNLIKAYEAWADDVPGKIARAARRKQLHSESTEAWVGPGPSAERVTGRSGKFE